MSVYNGERYLAGAIESIQAQTLRDFEFIVINDGSTDDTPEILRQFARKDSRLRVYSNERNIGLSQSLNRGLDRISAPFIARMDADDLSYPHRLETQLDYMRRHPGVDVVGSQMSIVGGKTIWSLPESSEDLLGLMCFNTPIFHPTAMIRTQGSYEAKLRRPFRYDDSFTVAQDYWLWVRLAIDYGAVYANVSEPLLCYRRHDQSLSLSRASVKRAAVDKIRAYQLRKLGIEPTRNDLNIHNALATQQLATDDRFLSKCAGWLHRLECANKGAQIYPSEAFARVLGQLWFDVSLHSLNVLGYRALQRYRAQRIGHAPEFAMHRLLNYYARSKLSPLKRVLGRSKLLSDHDNAL